MSAESQGPPQPDTNQQVYSRPCCEFCNTEIPGGDTHRYRCAHCNISYCSKEHKKADFRFHKQRCLNLSGAQSTNASSSFLTDSLANSQQYGHNNHSNVQSLPTDQHQVNPGFAAQLNPLSGQGTCYVDTRSPMSFSSAQFSPVLTIARAQVDPSSVSSRSHVSPKGQYNYQFFQDRSKNAPTLLRPQLPSIPSNQTQSRTSTSRPCSQTVTVQNALIPISNTNSCNGDEQIPLDDALVSFLQDAEQYDSSAVDTQDASKQGRLPRNLSGLLRDLTNECEEQMFYDQLLSLESTNTGGNQTTKADLVDKREDVDITLQSSSGLSSTVDSDQQVYPRMCQQFGLKNQDPNDGIAGCPLQEEGIFQRFNMTDVANYIVKSLQIHNYCVVDYLHGSALATAILEEIKQFHGEKNGFSEGRLSTPGEREGTPNKGVREDLVVWTDGNGRNAIKKHMSRVDVLMKLCNRFIPETEISSRTQAMVACYPGKGTGYKQHIDNPNKDGRCITTLYYLNPNWNIQTDGGILKLFPSGIERKTVNIEPLFDRLLLFWSDKRTPHEVTPAFKVRYAITLWYFNDEERKKYIQRYKEGRT